MKTRFGLWILVGIVTGSIAVAFSLAAEGPGEAGSKKADRALERTRKTVRMLDDVYKSAVVLITDKYVNDEDDFPAGSAAIALFDAVKQKNWHEVKLLDVSGEPYDDVELEPWILEGRMVELQVSEDDDVPCPEPPSFDDDMLGTEPTRQFDDVRVRGEHGVRSAGISRHSAAASSAPVMASALKGVSQLPFSRRNPSTGTPMMKPNDQLSSVIDNTVPLRSKGTFSPR